MPESVLQWIVFAGSFFLAGWAVGVAAESSRAFEHGQHQYNLGVAKRRLHTAQQWKTAGEFLALAAGGIAGSVSTLGIGAWVTAIALVISLLVGGWCVATAERRVHTLEAEMRRRAEERR